MDTGENRHHTRLGMGALVAVRKQHWEELEHVGPCHWWGSGCAGEGALILREGTGMSWALVQLPVSAGLWVPKTLFLTRIRMPLASRCPWIRVPWGVPGDQVSRGTLGVRVSWGTPGHWGALRCPWGVRVSWGTPADQVPWGVCRDQSAARDSGDQLVLGHS